MSIVFKAAKKLIDRVTSNPTVLQFRTEDSGLFRLGRSKWADRAEYIPQPWDGRCPQFFDGLAAMAGLEKAVGGFSSPEYKGNITTHEGMSGCCDYYLDMPGLGLYDKNYTGSYVHKSCNNKLNQTTLSNDPRFLVCLCEKILEVEGPEDIIVELVRVIDIEKMREEVSNDIGCSYPIKVDIT